MSVCRGELARNECGKDCKDVHLPSAMNKKKKLQSGKCTDTVYRQRFTLEKSSFKHFKQSLPLGSAVGILNFLSPALNIKIFNQTKLFLEKLPQLKVHNKQKQPRWVASVLAIHQCFMSRGHMGLKPFPAEGFA